MKRFKNILAVYNDAVGDDDVVIADKLAAALGMPVFRSGQTGTCLMVIDPDGNPILLDQHAG